MIWNGQYQQFEMVMLRSLHMHEIYIVFTNIHETFSEHLGSFFAGAELYLSKNW